jgi:aspartate kinase
MEADGDASPIWVIKLGGSILDGPASLAKASSRIKELLAKGIRPVLVASALKGATDQLLGFCEQMGKISPALLGEILSMGERTSARLLCAALEACGLSPELVEPGSRCWPIVTDEDPLDATPLYEECRRRAKRLLLPLLARGKVPVVCGYLGLSATGKVTTLGRGGSDTTAVLLGSCLGAEQVVLVKDVSGIFSADPKGSTEPTRLERLHSREALALANGGAKVIQPKALRFLREGMTLRVTSLDELAEGGTVIKGPAQVLAVSRGRSRLCVISVLLSEGSNRGLAGLLSALAKLRDSSPRLLVADETSALLYVEEGAAQQLQEALLKAGAAKAISSALGLTELVIAGSRLEERPGIIAAIMRPLAEQRINAHGLHTISSSVRLFVGEADAQRAELLIGRALGI